MQRRKGLAAGINDAETLALAEKYEAHHAERAGVLARKLEARFLVEGSVLLVDGLVRFDARVVDGANDRKIWVHEVSGPEADIPELQCQMAKAIANYLAARAKS